MYLNNLKNKLSQHNIYLKPADLDDVHLLEQKMCFKFPNAYKEFLLSMGNGADYFLRGSDCFIHEDFMEMREQAHYLLATHGHSEQILKDAFVFWMHQGYQMAFFYKGEGENPSIHYFSESEQDSKGIFHQENSLEDFLLVLSQYDL